jgi:hypothetical protein
MSSSDHVFPSTIRLMTPEEIQDGPYKDGRSRVELMERLAKARIRSGYVLRKSTDTLLKYYAEINVSAPDIWEVFTNLVEELLPEECAPLWGVGDDDPKKMARGNIENHASQSNRVIVAHRRGIAEANDPIQI